MIFDKLTPAIFIKRSNRFTAAVRLADGGYTTAHVPTTGRLTGALTPSCRVWLEPADNPARVTPYTLVLSELENGGLCSINAMMANRLFAEAVSANHLIPFRYDRIEKEVTVGESRLDFRLSGGKGVCWVEVKSVTFVEDGIGMFPDAPTSRGRKHLEELTQIAASGARAGVVFIAQREDARRFRPFTAIDPDFTKALHQAHLAGVEVYAFRCIVSLEKIEIVEEIKVEYL